MVSNLQFAAVAAYLLWCLFASLSDVIGPGREDGAGSAIDESDKNVSESVAPWRTMGVMEPEGSNDRTQDADGGPARGTAQPLGEQDRRHRAAQTFKEVRQVDIDDVIDASVTASGSCNFVTLYHKYAWNGSWNISTSPRTASTGPRR